MKNNNLLYQKLKEDILERIKGMNPEERIPSRNELIKEYNCTRTTVDRAISELIGEGYLFSKNGSGTYVSEEYLKNQQENKAKIDTWGVILPDIMKDTYPGILRGVEDVANSNDINTIICNSDWGVEKQNNYIYKLIDSNVKGVVIVPAIAEKIDLLPFKKLINNNIPFVFSNRKVPGIEAPQVISNSFYGGYIATKHLIEQGYKKIAYLSRPFYSTSLERYQGYTSALNERNMCLDEECVIFEESFFDIERPGYETTKKVLELDTPPDAIFCFNDTIAQGAYDAITDKGLVVGKDVGLVGYDNTNICESLPIKLTSVKFKTYEIGKMAAGLLLDMMHGKKVQKNKTVILQPELVVRESSIKDR